jgi:hypothetical protein
MKRLLAAAVIALFVSAPPGYGQQPPPADPALPPAEQPQPAEEPPATVPDPQPTLDRPADEDNDEPATVWMLEDREWDFGEVAVVYQPVRGIYLTETRSTVWMLELVRDLFPGEAGLHTSMAETPFRLVLLDEDRTVVEATLPLKLTPVTGKQGDRVLLSILLPDDDSLDTVKSIRVQRRTQVGFPVTDVLVDPTAQSRPFVVEEP